MGAHHLIAWLIIGLIAGALAGRLVEGGGYGIRGDIVVGLVGAFIGGLILHGLTRGNEATASFVGEILVAFAGAIILLGLLRLAGRGRTRRHGLFGAFRR